jgi:hypothetical protein
LARKNQNLPWSDCSTVRGGKTFTGRYQVDREMISVMYSGNLRLYSRSTQLSGMPPNVLAEMLLIEFVNQEAADRAKLQK